MLRSNSVASGNPAAPFSIVEYGFGLAHARTLPALSGQAGRIGDSDHRLRAA